MSESDRDSSWQTAVEPWALGVPRGLLTGRLGDQLGRGIGNSLDFVEHRDYAPGDDLRLLDWRAYARTDRMMVRRYRAEVSPVVEIVVDLSPSMAVTAAKRQATERLVAALYQWGRRGIGRVRVLARGGGPLELGDDGLGLPPCAAVEAGPWLPGLPFLPGSLRYLVSDFLEPRDPTADLRRMTTGASRAAAVQVLDPWEWDPEVSGLTTLRDVETALRLDVQLDAGALQRYGQRLARLCGAVRLGIEAGGGLYAAVRAGAAAGMFAEGLFPAGIIEPARGGGVAP